ncbi:metal-dependent hydrolase, partial [Streptomyces sp. NPDC059556]|uniref:metal-dependent hydrolase n=1 Tax=Streptomyces sp. NPDC059556 TaxID=3346863 RepID=UPI0036B48402
QSWGQCVAGRAGGGGGRGAGLGRRAGRGGGRGGGRAPPPAPPPHRSVAFELFMHLDGGYRRRARTWALAFSALVFLWQRGVRFFMENDPTLLDGKASLGQFVRKGRQGVLPSTPAMLRSIPRYLSRAYHPSQEGDTAQAMAYLASSPGANGGR